MGTFIYPSCLAGREADVGSGKRKRKEKEMKKSNLKILILIGIPGSGKSTWAKEFVRNHADYVRVNRDDFRMMLKNSQLCENKIEDMITKMIFNVIGECLGKKLNVIVDNTNLKQRYIDNIIENFRFQADIDYRVFDISLDKAIERDNGRDAKVGAGVIKKMVEDYKYLTGTFDFQPVKMQKAPLVQPDWDSELPEAVLFDIDGTLAHMGNRGPFDWMEVYRDDINRIVVEHIDFHRSLGRIIIFVTGRDEVCRAVTLEWCELHGFKPDVMFMRPAGDGRKDTVVKREILHHYVQGTYNPICVYDDRLQVLDMWNKEGIFTFNVNQGQKNF